MSFKVIGIGEVLWDLLPSGPQLGGAPANFAHHAMQLGAQAKVITRVGRDELGHKIVRHFEGSGAGGRTIQQDDAMPTGTAKVVLNPAGEPQFVLDAVAAWDFIAFNDEVEKTVADASAICFGSLAQRHPVAAATIQRAVAATPFEALRVFDINLRQDFFSRELLEPSLHSANVLKLNEHELTVLEQMFGLPGSAPRKIEQLADLFGLSVIALTRGRNGSLLFQDGNWSEVASEPVEVADTVGAGDAFTAALTMGLLQRLARDELHRFASNVASFVCSCRGATPVLPPRLRSEFLKNLKAPV